MDNKEFEKYYSERYLSQIKWYSNKASINKTIYSIFQWGVICLSSSLPVLISTIPNEYKLITIIFSIVLAIGTAALKTFKWQEIWINYRTISETLKKEKYYYDAGIDEYGNSDDKNQLFVERVENLISRENSLWIMTHNEKKIKKTEK